MDTKYQRRKTSVSLLYAHLVFSAKYRRKVITPRVRNTLLSAAYKTCARLGVVLTEANGEADHLHLMVLFPPSLALSKIVQAVKAESSGAVRRQAFPEVVRKLRGDAFWSPSYFVASCGGAPLEIVKAYIQGQNADAETAP